MKTSLSRKKSGRERNEEAFYIDTYCIGEVLGAVFDRRLVFDDSSGSILANSLRNYLLELDSDSAFQLVPERVQAEKVQL